MSEDKPIVLFGHDIRKIPCFRNTFLYGISSGIGGGILIFLCTSKPWLASHSGMGIYAIVATSYWIQCRIKHINSMITMGQLQGALEKANIMRGTEEEEFNKLERASVDA